MDDRDSTTRAATDEYGHSLYGEPGDWEIVEAVRAVAAERERDAGRGGARLAPLEARRSPRRSSGATKMPHLDAAIRAVELTLTPEEIERLEAPYRPHAVRGHH